MALFNPVAECLPNLTASRLKTQALVHALRFHDTTLSFDQAAHRKAMAEGHSATHSSAKANRDTILATYKTTLPKAEQQRLDRICNTGLWLSAFPTLLGRTVLSAQEWRDNLSLRFDITPPGIPAFCDGCKQSASLAHLLHCPNGGLTKRRHDELRDELRHIARQVFPPNALTDNPRLGPPSGPTLQHGPNVRQSAQQPSAPSNATDEEKSEEKLEGDLGICTLFENGTTAIIDIRVVNMDARTHFTRKPDSVVTSIEKAKISKYAEACTSRRESFHPFVSSADGMLGPQADKVLQRLARLISDSTERPYSVTMNFLRLRMSIAVAKTVHLMLRHTRIRPAKDSQQSQQQQNEPIPEYMIMHG